MFHTFMWLFHSSLLFISVLGNWGAVICGKECIAGAIPAGRTNAPMYPMDGFPAMQVQRSGVSGAHGT